MNTTPNLQSHFDSIHIHRLIQSVAQLAAGKGYDGDLFADPVPQPKTEEDLRAAGELYLGLKASIRSFDRDLAKRFCNAAVFGRTRRTVTPLVNVAHFEDKLTRERRRCFR